jgi:hypothetical protein
MSDIRATRYHPTLESRREQITLNLKAIEGGRPYIDARLSRHACESDTSWGGTARTIDGGSFSVPGVIGRKDRASYTNYAARIAGKINQLISSGGVQREGVDPMFAADATRTGVSLAAFMDTIGEMFTGGGWCWISVDRLAAPTDADGNPVPRSVADREQSGDRAWWNAWSAVDVPDWKFGTDGKLEWLITDQVVYISDTPDAKPERVHERTIWTRGTAQKLRIMADGKVEAQAPIKLSHGLVPFVPVGVPSPRAWWFDDIEMGCAQLLNLESCHHENLYSAGFPQLIIPDDLITNVMNQAGCSFDKAMQMARGLNFPIGESAASANITRFIQPNATDLGALPSEIQRKRGELFEVVGMALKRESAQVESAEAKRLGLLDVSAVLAQRAAIMQAAETAAVKLSKVVDSTFQEYAPVYPTEFDIGDTAGNLNGLVTINSMTLPDGARRETAKAAIRELARIGRIAPERVTELNAEVDEMDVGGMGALLDFAADAGNRDGDTATPAATPGAQPVEKTALNGAQVTALAELASQVALGQLPVKTARAIAVAAFPAVDAAIIDSIFGGLESFTPEPPPEAKPAATPAAG